METPHTAIRPDTVSCHFQEWLNARDPECDADRTRSLPVRRLRFLTARNRHHDAGFRAGPYGYCGEMASTLPDVRLDRWTDKRSFRSWIASRRASRIGRGWFARGRCCMRRGHSSAQYLAEPCSPDGFDVVSAYWRQGTQGHGRSSLQRC